ncbi:MAG: exonuclease [Chromatiaceae bacterium]|nr:exonuclease [Chromatiaceae bacterium]
MDENQWTLLDTETTGFKAPIYVLDIAAQRMRGWKPEGPPFSRILNHAVDIPPEASRVNGYTREILERDGDTPKVVYDAFAAYVGDRPLVAYNLSYDLDEVLRPEWKRLGIEPIGHPGFCVLRLTRRLLDPVPAGNHKLQTLRQYYRLPQRGAHTALGDVETTADLMQHVLKPLAEERGLTTWEAISSFADALWFPSRLAFGKFKGRSFRDALFDQELRDWLEWLTRSPKPRTSAMGRWYLEQLDLEPDYTTDVSVAITAGENESNEIVLFRHPELETLRQLIANARDRLAGLEAEYTQEHHRVQVAQSELFARLRPHYERRDALRLEIQYRRKYLETLLIEGEEEAETVGDEYTHARDESAREYEEAAAEAATRQALTDDEEQELKRLHQKLVRLYHPDRFADDPDRQAIYDRLMQEINQGRDQGDIDRLREIANDPNGFLLRQGLTGLDFDDDAELVKLRQLYVTLQERILSILAEIDELRASDAYELYRLSQERPRSIAEVADQQAQEILAELDKLEEEAKQLAEEIEKLTGSEDPFINEAAESCSQNRS